MSEHRSAWSEDPGGDRRAEAGGDPQAMTGGDPVDRGDLDEVLRQIDWLCSARDWPALVALRDRCRQALARGHQLWPAASHAEYRLALEAPGRWAAPMLVPDSGRFALGPLAEVAASTHSWAELAPHVPPTPDAALAAHERVVRGEDLTADATVDRGVLELPLRLQTWEPAYPVAVYRAHEAHFPEGAAPRLDAASLPSPGRQSDDPEGRRALAELAQPWTTESNGGADAVAVEGDAPSAIAALEPSMPTLLAAVAPEDALSAMAWTAASGGAHGRRRGTAVGRFAAWWTVAALAGLLGRWPLDPDEVGEAACTLSWYRWDEASAPVGWSLRLAVEDRGAHRAWALRATDRA
jgi:hypothetical protein